MWKRLLRPFKMRYLERQKVDTFIDSTLFFMSFKVPVPMMLLVFMGIRREVFNTGFNDSSPTVFKGYGIEIALGVPVDSLS